MWIEDRAREDLPTQLTLTTETHESAQLSQSLHEFACSPDPKNFQYELHGGVSPAISYK